MFKDNFTFTVSVDSRSARGPEHTGECGFSGVLGQEAHQDASQCYSDIPAYKNRCQAYSNTQSHRRSDGVPLCFTRISYAASQIGS